MEHYSGEKPLHTSVFSKVILQLKCTGRAILLVLFYNWSVPKINVVVVIQKHITESITNTLKSNYTHHTSVCTSLKSSLDGPVDTIDQDSLILCL